MNIYTKKVTADVQISFTCPGGFDAQQLPDWIRVLPFMEGKKSESTPVFSSSAIAAPVKLLEVLIPNSTLRLTQVGARQKSTDKHGTYWVLTFSFNSRTPALDHSEEHGRELLLRLLTYYWRKLRIYQTYREKTESTLISVSATERVCIKGATNFSPPNSWGIRELIT